MKSNLRTTSFKLCLAGLAAAVWLAFFPQTIQAATITWDGGGADNNWSTCANWSGDTCPTSVDAVVFSNTSTKNSTVDAGFGGVVTSVSINAGYTGTITQGRSLQTSSTFTQSAGFYTAANQTLDVNGIFTLNTGSNFTASSTSMFFATNFTILGGTFNHNSGTITFDGAGGTLSCNNNTFNSIVFSNTGQKSISSNCSLPIGTNPTVGPNLVLSGTLSGSGTIAVNSGAFTVDTSALLSGFTGISVPGNFVVNGSTNNLSSFTTFTVGGINMSAGTLTLPSTVTTGAITLSGGTFNAPSGTMTVGAGLTISGSPTFNANGGTINFSATGGTISLSCNNVTFNQVNFTGAAIKSVSSNCSIPLGNNPSVVGSVTLNGTLSGSGTLSFASSSTIFTINSGGTLSGFTGLSSPILIISGGTVNLSSYSTFIANNTTTVSSGALTLPSGSDLNSSLTISGGTFTAPSGTMTLAGSLTISGTPTFNANGGTISFDANSAATLACNNVTFSLVRFTHIANTKTINSDCNLPLGNNPTLGSGDSNTTVINNGVLSGTGTLTTGRLTLNSGSSLTGFSGINAGALLTVSGANADFSNYATFVAASTVTLSSGSLSVPSGADFNGIFTISGGTFNAPSGTISISGNLAISGSPTFNANGGTISFDGETDGTITCNSVAFNLVTFTHTGAATKTIGTNCTIPIGNNPTVTGRIRLNASTATLSGSGLFTSTCEQSSCLRITSGNFTGFNGMIIYGNLSVDGGTLDLSNYDPVTIYGRNSAQSFSVSSGGTLTAPTGLITVYDGVNIQATFNHNNGTLRFLAEPADTVFGFNGLPASLTLNNLIVDPEIAATFSIPAGSEVVVLGDLTLKGIDESNLLRLRPSVSGSLWHLDAQGETLLQYLDVQDSNNTGSTSLNAVCSVDSGNNTNWLFPPCNGSLFHLVSPSDRVYIRDGRPTFSWRPPSDQSLFDAAREYSLVIDNGQNSDFIVEGIPAQRPGNGSVYETETYRVEYLNWDNEDLNDNLISVVTKSSKSWPNDYNDGKLTEGRRSWRVKLKDSGNSVYEMSNELFVDFTPPTTSISKINTLDYVPAVLTSDTTPTIFGKVTDQLMGSGEDRKVAVGPKSISLLIEQKSFGGYTEVLTDSISLSESFWEDDGKEIENNTENRASKFSPFEYTPTKSLTNGTYRITLKPADNVDNSFATQMFQIRVGGYQDVFSTLNEEDKTTYADQINQEQPSLTIPDPNEDQTQMVEALKQQLDEKNSQAEKAESDSSRYKKPWLIGLGVLAIFITWWFLLFWKRRKSKQKQKKS